MAYNTQEGYYTVGETGIEPWYKTYKWYLLAIAAAGVGGGYWYMRRRKQALYGCGCK